MPRNFFKAVVSYMKDWKNLLFHTLVGVTILVIALFVPVHPIFRVLFLVAVITFNIIRMRTEKKRKSSEKIPGPVKVPISDD